MLKNSQNILNILSYIWKMDTYTFGESLNFKYLRLFVFELNRKTKYILEKTGFA